MKRMLASALALAVTTLSLPLTLIPEAYASQVIVPVDNTVSTAVTENDQAVRLHPNLVTLMKSWTVQDGQTLSSIAAARYGTQNAWTLIYWANHPHIRWADRIQVGQVLALPMWNDPIPAAPRFTSPPPPPAPVVVHRVHSAGSSVAYSGSTYHRAYSSGTYSGSGTYSFAGLEALWISAGGPSWAASHAASIAECESGGRVNAYNPSGATGLWQILGSVVGGSLTNPYVNAANAVAKFKASGDTFAQWVCR